MVSYRLKSVAPFQLFAMLVAFFGLLSRPCIVLDKARKVSGCDIILGTFGGCGLPVASTPDTSTRLSNVEYIKVNIMITKKVSRLRTSCFKARGLHDR